VDAQNLNRQSEACRQIQSSRPLQYSDLNRVVLTELQCALTIHRTLSCVGVDNNIVRIIDIVFGVIES